jgi:hypothetical protein
VHATFVVGLPDRAVFRTNEPVPAGVRLEALLREGRPLSEDGQQLGLRADECRPVRADVQTSREAFGRTHV